MEYTRIVAIDDTPMILTFIRHALHIEGYMISTASNGEKGLALIEQYHPHLILLDQSMPPGLTGLEVVHRLRATGNMTPIIMMSAGDIDCETALMQGCQGFLSKPFHLKELHALVKKNLHRPQHLLEQQKDLSGESFLP